MAVVVRKVCQFITSASLIKDLTFGLLLLLLLLPFYDPLSGTTQYPREPVPEETFTLSHLSWSSIILYLLQPSTTIYCILPVQFMCLTILLHKLSPSSLWSTSWFGTLHFILHTFLHPFIVFLLQHMPIAPYQCNLFCCSTKIMSSNPSLSQLITWNSIFYLNATHPSDHPSDHSHLCLLKCHLILLQTRSHFHATYYFVHNCHSVSLSSSMTYPYS